MVKWFAGADPGFQVKGAQLRILGVFRVKIHDFTPKKQITESPIMYLKYIVVVHNVF
jgi:hypothetical protein